MAKEAFKIDGVRPQSLYVIHEFKRAVRLALANSSLSRDQVVDRMNEIAVAEGIRQTVSKAVIDGWCKASDMTRKEGRRGACQN